MLKDNRQFRILFCTVHIIYISIEESKKHTFLYYTVIKTCKFIIRFCTPYFLYTGTFSNFTNIHNECKRQKRYLEQIQTIFESNNIEANNPCTV